MIAKGFAMGIKPIAKPLMVKMQVKVTGSRGRPELVRFEATNRGRTV